MRRSAVSPSAPTSNSAWCSAHRARPLAIVDQCADRLLSLQVIRPGTPGGGEPAEQPQQQQRLVRGPDTAHRSPPQSGQQVQAPQLPDWPGSAPSERTTRSGLVTVLIARDLGGFTVGGSSAA
jgi:hypothetical protein